MANRAAEMMTKTPAVISDETALEDVMSFFIEKGITSAPVVNRVGRILGVMTDIIMVKAILLSRSKGFENDALFNYENLLQTAEFVHEDSGIQEVFKAMVKSPYHRVLVKSDDGDLLGIISPKDLMRYLVGERVHADNLNKEAEEYQNKIRSLESEREELSDLVSRYEKMIQETPSMIHSVNADGVIIMANKKLHNVLRYKDGALNGETFLKLYDPVHHNNAKAGLKKVMEYGYHRPLYTTMMTRDGERVKVEIVTSALKDRTGKFLGTITVSRQHENEDLLDILKNVEKGTL